MLTDLSHLREVIKESSEFREVLKNSSVRRSKQREIFGAFAPQTYHQITNNFIETVIEAGRYSPPEVGWPSSRKSLTPTSFTARSSTRRRTSGSSQPQNSIIPNVIVWSLPSRKTSPESGSKSPMRSMHRSSEDCRSSRGLSFWTAR